jgi:hypothetical protein
VEPNVYPAVASLVGKRVVVETTRGNVSGMLIDAKPDHIVIQGGINLFEVVWIIPDPLKK